MEELVKENINWNKDVFCALTEILSRTDKAVISKWTSANFWGFGMSLDNSIELTFPRGYNMRLDFRFKKIQRSGIRYSEGIKYIDYKDKKMKIYSPERTIVELIKDARGIYDDVLLKSVKNFFDHTKYDSRELVRWAKIFKILAIVNQFEIVSRKW